MLAGLLILSAATGGAAMLVMAALSTPVWMMLAAYPAICGLALMLSAALWTIRAGDYDRDELSAPVRRHA